MSRQVFRGYCRVWAAVVVVGLILGWVVVPASAQESAAILGTVRDSSGGVVAAAKVTAINTDTNEIRLTNSAEDGSYRIPGLKPGNYSVKIEKEGFKTATQTSVVLNVAAEVVVNSTMEVGSATQEVTVNAEAPIINTTTSSLGNLVNDQTISELPLNGRNYTDLTLLAPGVVQATHSGLGDAGLWYSSNGAPPRSNNYMLDGAVTVTKNGTGPSSITGATLGVDGIKEYRVVTSMFSANYGLLMGSQMVIVSKSGTNRWHGAGFEYLRNNHLDARNFFDPQPNLANHILTDASGNLQRLPQFKRNNFGASLGGPIQKDKTFFFLVYEGVRVAQGDTIQNVTMNAACHFVTNGSQNVIIGGGPLTTIATAALPAGFSASNQQILKGPLANGPWHLVDGKACNSGLAANQVVDPVVQPWIGQFPFPNESTVPGNPSNNTFNGFSHARDDYSQLRVDHTFSDSDSLFARYTIDDGVIHTPFLGGNLSLQDTGTGYPQYSNVGRSRNQYITLGENHIFTPNLLNSFRLSFSRMIYKNDFNQANTPMNPDFLLQDDTSTCNYGPNPVCIWSGVPGLFTMGFNPGSGVTALTPPGTFPNYHYNNVWTLDEDVYFTRGKHSFQFGFLGTRMNQPHLQSKSIFGAITYGSLLNFMTDTAQNFNVVTPGTGASDPSCNPALPCNQLSAQFGNSGFLDRDHTWYTLGFYGQDDYRITSHLTLNLGLRYEFMTPITEMFDRQSTVVDIRTSINPSLVPSAIWQNSTYKNWSPRVGVAWDVFGNGRTAVRSGFGIYYDVGNIGALLTQNSTGVLPFVANTTLQQNLHITLPLLPVLKANNVPAGRSLQLGDYQDRSPHSLQYNLTVEQQLPLGIGLSVSFVGRRGLNLYTGLEGNPTKPSNLVNGVLPPNTVATYDVSKGLANCFNHVIPVDPITGVPQPYPVAPAFALNPLQDPGYPCRVNPYFGSALFFTNAASSWYNSLQVNVNKRLARGLIFQAAYTYSRSTDTTEGTRFNDDCGGPAQANFGHNPFNLALDYAPSCFDVTHAMHFNLLYHLPGINSSGFVSKFTNGWWVGNLVSVQGGNPFVPIVNNDRSFSGIVSQNPASVVSLNTAAVTNAFGSFIPYNPDTVITGNPNQWYNPFMFGVPALGQLGTAPRSILRGPGLGTWDFSLVKDTKLGLLGEEGNVQFRAEFFNMLNRANFGFMNAGMTAFNASTTAGSACPAGTTYCNNTAPLSTAGQITTTSTTARQIQLALRVSF
jgi:hypothetical protein